MCGLFKVLKYENHSSALTLDWSLDLFEEDAARRDCTSYQYSFGLVDSRVRILSSRSFLNWAFLYAINFLYI